MQYLEFRSRAEFFRTPLKPSWFDHNYLMIVQENKDDWSRIKPLILHQDCPDRIKHFYTMHPKWYIRLTAMLNKFSWRKYVVQATNDEKSTVRAAAYRRLLENIGESPIKALDLLKKMEEDKRTHNYFDMNDIRDFLQKEGQI